MEYTMGRVVKYVSDGEKMSIVYIDDFSAYGEYQARFEKILNAVEALPEEAKQLMLYVDLQNKLKSKYQSEIDEVLAREDIKEMIAEDRVHAVGLEIAHKVAAKIFGEDVLITKEELNNPEFVKAWELFHKEYINESVVFSFPLDGSVIRSFVEIMEEMGVLQEDYDFYEDDLMYTNCTISEDGSITTTHAGLSLIKDTKPSINMTKEQFEKYISMLVEGSKSFPSDFVEACKQRDAKKYVEFFKEHGVISYDSEIGEVDFKADGVIETAEWEEESLENYIFGVSPVTFSRKEFTKILEALKAADSPMYDFICLMRDKDFEEAIQSEGRAYLRIDEEGNPYPQETSPQGSTEQVDEFTLNGGVEPTEE